MYLCVRAYTFSIIIAIVAVVLLLLTSSSLLRSKLHTNRVAMCESGTRMVKMYTFRSLRPLLSLYPSLSRCIYLPCDTLLVNGRKCATEFVSFQCLCVHTAVLSLLFNIGRSLLSFSLSMYVCVSCVVLREYENGRTLNAWVCVCVCMRAVFFLHLVLSSSKRQPFVCSLLYRWVYVCMYGCVSVLCA